MKQLLTFGIVLLAMFSGCTSDLSKEETRTVSSFLLEDPTFESTVRHLNSEGKSLDWPAMATDGDVSHGPLTVIIPVLKQDELIANLVFDREIDGVVNVSLVEYTQNQILDESETTNRIPSECVLTNFQYHRTCKIATPLGSCVNGAPHYKLTWYWVDIYENGRDRETNYYDINYYCGSISSDAVCSDACYSGPLPTIEDPNSSHR